MNNLLKYMRDILLLVILHGLIDKLYVYIYPTVNPSRATLIGLTALLILGITYFIPFVKNLQLSPIGGFLAIYSSAFFGALLVQAGVVVSKSLVSALAHIAILIVTYLVVDTVIKRLQKTNINKQ